VVWGSCVPDDGVAEFIEDVWYDQENFLALQDAVPCLSSRGGGCDAVQDCTGVIFANDGPCLGTCTGNVYSGCDDSWHFTADCGRYGLICMASDGCVVAGAMACDFATFTPSCDTQGRPTYCSGVIEQGPRCADYRDPRRFARWLVSICRGGTSILGEDQETQDRWTAVMHSEARPAKLEQFVRCAELLEFVGGQKINR